MSLVKFDPFAELNALHEQMNSLFNSSFGATAPHVGTLPTTDVYSDDKALTVETHLPHFKEDEISVDQHEGVLEIRAERTEKEEDKKKYLQRESATKFYRRIALPKNANAENIEAHLNDGILKVTVPYKELPKPKKIAITAGNKKK